VWSCPARRACASTAAVCSELLCLGARAASCRYNKRVTDTILAVPSGLAGQDTALQTLRLAARRPVHAYLFVGPPGTGKLVAARAFGAMLLCPNGGEDNCEICKRVVSHDYPDFVLFEREGASLTIDQAREVTRVAARSALEGGKLVIVLPEFHLAREAVPALLKTIEEPPASTVFIILAEFVPPELITIASRCVRVDFRPFTSEQIINILIAEGLTRPRAASIAGMANGRLDRARLLATDPEAESRWRSWAAVPGRLDGTGLVAATIAEELAELLKRSVGPLSARQDEEMKALVERNSQQMSMTVKLAPSLARQGVKELEETHKREQRRQRTDELRTGLAALAGAYRDRAAAGTMDAGLAVRAVGLIDQLSADLVFNPGELLALQALLVRLGRLV